MLLGGESFSEAEALTGGWFSAVSAHAIDAPFPAYLPDAWFPSPFVRMRAAAATARHGLLVEDGAMSAADVTLLAYSRQSATARAVLP